jgi:cytochrome c
MSPREAWLTLGLALGACAADAQDFGAPVAPAELARYAAIPPSGVGLPHGRGEVERGRAVYADKCAACHGENLQGVAETGGVALIGGRGTLVSAKPLKTVESYWPYATTLFDYVRRAMPMNAPGSLTDDEVYAVSAYILASGHVIAPDAALDENTLPKVEMPNRSGFYRDPRPK